MLILVHGFPSIAGKIAQKIFIELNNIRNYPVENYTVDFVVDGFNSGKFNIYDSNKDLVYGDGINKIMFDQTSTLEYKPFSEEGNRIFDKIRNLSSLVYQSASISGEYKGYRLSSWDKDFDVTFEDDRLVWSEQKYQSILNHYSDQIFDYTVLTGLFSNSAIDQFKVDLGNDNVQVINITRNPSVGYLTTPEWKVEQAFLEISQNKIADIRLFNTYFNSVKHKRNNNLTYKFEDILQNGYIHFDGRDIDMSETFNAYNQYITEDEFTKLNQSIQNNENDLLIATDLFNDLKESFRVRENCCKILKKVRQSNYTLGSDPNVTNYENIDISDLPSADISNVPSNIFSELDYQPLSYQDIVSKS